MKTVKIAAAAFFKEVGEHLNGAVANDFVYPMDVQAALTHACRQTLGNEGGVVMLWWDGKKIRFDGDSKGDNGH